jgi:hypothetical protein
LDHLIRISAGLVVGTTLFDLPAPLKDAVKRNNGKNYLLKGINLFTGRCLFLNEQ